VDDKEMPNVPLSQINIVDGRPGPGSVQILRNRWRAKCPWRWAGGEWSDLVEFAGEVEREVVSHQSSVVSFQSKFLGCKFLSKNKKRGK